MNNRKWFSILIAIWTIGVLLIIVVWLASVYLREMKLSRTSYDDIVASAGAEWAFEYWMLKVQNHREGFADSMNSDDLDGKMLTLASDRSHWMKTAYTITANSQDSTFTIAPNDHLIIPLFASNEVTLWTTGSSKYPNYNPRLLKSQNVVVSWIPNLSWTIIAMNGSENIGISGTWDIIASTNWTIRHKDTQCYNSNGDKIDCSNVSSVAEEIPYFYDETRWVSDFLADSTIANPYLMIYNSENTSQDVHITASTPFALPQMTIEATAQKWDSLQIFRFTEDKSKYYDALKYGVYNTQ